jgi:hypothetical protein
MSSHLPQDELTLSSMPLVVPSKKVGLKVRLHYNFTPGKYAVLCGRGSKCTKSTGNQRLREIVKKNLAAYSEARSKVEKTAIVTAIIDTVKQASPDGAFLKFEDDCWWEVEDSFAREKIGCLFRDSLHTQYKSSTKAKLARKSSVAGEGALLLSGETTVRYPCIGRRQSALSVAKPPKMTVEDLLNPAVTGAIGSTSSWRNPDNMVVGPHSLARGIPLKINDVIMKHKDLGALYVGSSNQGGRRMHGPDFMMRDCLPALNLLMSSNKTEEHVSRRAAGVPASASSNGSRHQSQTSSYLRAACGIVAGGPTSSTPNDCYKSALENGDIPDDFSDMFEEDDDTDKDLTNFDIG